MATRVRRFAVVANLLYALLLLMLGVSPGIPGITTGISDRFAHMAASGLHVVLLFWLLRAATGARTAAFLAAAAASLYGGFIEAMQLMQPARTVEMADLATNAIGACSTAVLLFLFAGRNATEVRQ